MPGKVQSSLCELPTSLSELRRDKTPGRQELLSPQRHGEHGEGQNRKSFPVWDGSEPIKHFWHGLHRLHGERQVFFRFPELKGKVKGVIHHGDTEDTEKGEFFFRFPELRARSSLRSASFRRDKTPGRQGLLFWHG